MSVRGMSVRGMSVRGRENERGRENVKDGWTFVSPRRRRMRRPARNRNDKTDIDNKETITCYVNNLPEDISEREMERTFERWGKVIDVYIASKRNKMGKIFGFIRYGGIQDATWIEEQLKDIWFGSYKVWVNVSRFSRPNRRETSTNNDRLKESKLKSKQHRGSDKITKRITLSEGQNGRRVGMLYAEVAKGFRAGPDESNKGEWRSKALEVKHGEETKSNMANDIVDSLKKTLFGLIYVPLDDRLCF
ncbi:unnamed protein product [Vicia faba]|uniref:RRM domain-containing protein n=1 Tax=Vicia faba TaxID=3906 RepID=A0AAV0ZZL6_VICFA|nr:unnamed protein product [Vicia faba]